MIFFESRADVRLSKTDDTGMAVRQVPDAKELGKKNILMGEGQKEKELQLELAELRNPYLEKEFARRQERQSAGAVRAREKAAYTGERRRQEQQAEWRRPERQRQEQRRREALKRKACKRAALTGVLLLISAAVLYGLVLLFSKDIKDREGKNASNTGWETLTNSFTVEKPDWITDYLTPNEYSRPGDAIDEVKNIFVHYTANPGTSAAQNRSYFEQLKDTHERSASAHFIIGYDGEIIQCIPLDEIAYAVQTRNYDSISIECCYLEENGDFTPETEESLIKLLVYLLQTYGLDSEDILRHYDCGGKKCPLYYVEHEEAWEELKKEVKQICEDNGG